MSTYIVLALCHNEVQYIKPFISLTEAETKAVFLANEWYRKVGIESFGKERIGTVEEMRDYYSSEAYIESGDAAHICIEDVSTIDSSCSPNVEAFPVII